MSTTTAARIMAGTAGNTNRAYDRQWTEFTAWCDANERTAKPADDATLAEYVSHLIDRDLSPSTIEQAIATVRRRHRDAGLPGPDTRGARLALRSHKRARATAGHRAHQAPPAAIAELRAMVDATPDTVLGLRDRALLLLGFALMARRSELVALDVSDVREVDEGLLVTIRASKTDQDAEGAVVAVPFGSNPQTCPVRTVRAWLATLADAGITCGPLLRSVSRHGRVGGRMTGEGVRLAVRTAAGRAGLANADAYSAHSLRAGGATAAAKKGAPVSAIARHGRWSEKSPVVHSYIRAVDQWRENPMVGVGL